MRPKKITVRLTNTCAHQDWSEDSILENHVVVSFVSVWVPFDGFEPSPVLADRRGWSCLLFFALGFAIRNKTLELKR